MNYGDVAVNATVRFTFTTQAATGAAVAPSTAFEAADIRLYKGSSAVERSSQAGWTMTSPFDTITGLHHIVMDLSDNTDAGFYAAGNDYTVVLSPDETVDGLVVVAVIGMFSIENRSGLRPTTAGRTLDVSATGEAGLDWANIGAPTTAQNLSATNIDVDQVVASVSGAVGSVTGAVGSVAAGGITAASFTAGAIDNAAFNVTETLTANPATGGIAALSFAAGAIDAAAIAADAITSSELAQTAAQEVADEVLNRDLVGGASGNTRNVRNALRTLRNKVAEAAGTATVYEEDDTTAAWTAAVTRTAGTNAITTVDPV